MEAMCSKNANRMVNLVAGSYLGSLALAALIIANDRVHGPFHHELRSTADKIEMVATAIANPERFEQIVKERAELAP